MADIRAFKAIRPAKELACKVAALPYDVMNTEEAREMVKGNPYSFLHVDKAEIDLDPSVHLYDPSVYAKAAENLDNMVKDKVFIQDETPYLYIYMQTMGEHKQTGVVACASIDEYLSGKIKKHELTREDKEQDRIRHVDITNANTGPIFLTYPHVNEIDEAVDSWKKSHEAVYDFVSDDGIGHTVWVINDEAVIKDIRSQFAKLSALYIADGHHRNASAVKVGLKRREQNPNYSPDAEFNFYLSVIFPDNQLYIMDYNRIVKNYNGLTADGFMKEVENKFIVAEYKGEGCFHPSKLHEFGMYMEGKWYSLTAKPEIIKDGDPVASLDVSILQDNLLEPVLGIKDPRTDKNIDFVGGMRGLQELANRVDSGEMKVAFSMFPTSLGELFAIADAGKMMPPKSTWFEPKLRSGIFVHKLD